jgi:uncharacterized protein (DUF2235 family)
MPKNIVICCDGTNGEFRLKGDTNVVRLYSLLVHDREQVAFYDPGLGTMGAPGALTALARAWTRLLGLAFGYGLDERITEAYEQLMASYDEGDRIFLFGFSRGAYTVRALASMLEMFGLVDRGNDTLVPYITRMFKHGGEERFRLAQEFKWMMSRPCPIHFVGVWDTVSSVGWFTKPLKLPYTANNPSIANGRHAVSIDERRGFFRQNLWGPPSKGQDLKQVWFAGVHSDVGGGYPVRESGLANVTLRWMLDESVAKGLRIDSEQKERVLASPDGGADVDGPVHDSLSLLWWPLEFIPRPVYHSNGVGGSSHWEIPLGRRRRMPAGAVLDATVRARMASKALAYRPPNLPIQYSFSVGPPSA